MLARSLISRALAVLLLLGPAFARGQEIGNPELFTKSLEAARQALEYYGSYDNPKELRRVADLGYRIAQETEFTSFPFSFFLVDIPVPNAFALPGGQIFLTRGMLDLEPTDEMLAGLLGHEIGHVVKEHGTRMQRRATLLNVLSQALLAGVIIAANDSDDDYVPPGGYYPKPSSGDRVMGAAAAGVVVSELLLRSYSREFEDEADDEGQRFAAGAGFDPDGYRQLMVLMQSRLPESKEYGYWRTHPFFESRIRAAAVREELLTVQEPRPADDYRHRTQKALLSFANRGKVKEEGLRMLEDAALAAWPIGEAADDIRLARLHEIRDRELEEHLLRRDYGDLLVAYRETYQDVESIDPESPLLAKLAHEMKGFEVHLEEAYPQAVEVFQRGVFETDFLETFTRNYPEATELPAIALQLGDAYSRLRRPADAVEMYLEAWKSAPETEAGRKARIGLRSLASSLDRLDALQHLTDETEDPELQRLAKEQLEKTVGTFTDLANGATYLREYPESAHTEAVTNRLHDLADNLYGEAILYQRVGDHAKALDRIHSILTEAPLSPAAERLRQKAILEG
jgi:predicted Zn-dependent protease